MENDDRKLNGNTSGQKPEAQSHVDKTARSGAQGADPQAGWKQDPQPEPISEMPPGFDVKKVVVQIQGIHVATGEPKSFAVERPAREARRRNAAPKTSYAADKEYSGRSREEFYLRAGEAANVRGFHKNLFASDGCPTFASRHSITQAMVMATADNCTGRRADLAAMEAEIATDIKARVEFLKTAKPPYVPGANVDDLPDHGDAALLELHAKSDLIKEIDRLIRRFEGLDLKDRKYIQSVFPLLVQFLSGGPFKLDPARLKQALDANRACQVKPA